MLAGKMYSKCIEIFGYRRIESVKVKVKSKYLLKAHNKRICTCTLNQLQKLEQTIYNIRLFMKVICTVWKLES